MGTRLAAWIVTGPLGHLWSGVADWVVFMSRWIAGRLAARLRVLSGSGRGAA